MASALLPTQRLGGLPRTAVIWCIALAVATVPLGTGRTRYGFDPGRGYSLTLWVGLVDIMLLLSLAFGFRATLHRVRARQTAPLIEGSILLLAGLVVSSLIHPVDRGIAIVLRLAGAIVVADWVASADRNLLRTVGKIIATLAVGEWCLSLFQLATKGPLGLWFLGERSDPFFRWGETGETIAPTGTFIHSYLLAGFLAAAMSVVVVLAFLGLSTKPTAFVVTGVASSAALLTYSRVSVLSVFLMLAVLGLLTIKATTRRLAAGLILWSLLVSTVTFSLTLDGWNMKKARSDAGGITSGRVELLQENLQVVRKHPFFGTGTGRYTMSLLDEGQDLGPIPRPPHMVPMAALAEAGILSVPGMLLQGFAALLLVLRRRWVALLPLASLLSPLMLEQFMWNTPEGMMMVALGFGAASLAQTWRSSEERTELHVGAT